jgi:hypothetical protein
MAKISSPAHTSARPGVQIDVNTLMDQARKNSGLSDFGDLWFMEPLNSLVGFVNREGGLTSSNPYPVQMMVRMLADRLQLVDFLKRHPDVVDEKLNVLGIIVAHARGGSTLTQRLLARSPQLTSTYFWELQAPIPLRDEAIGDPTPRKKLGDEGVQAWLNSMPEYRHMHPQDAQYHEEDMLINDRCFLSFFYSCHFNIPSYLPWMVEQDSTRAYEEFKLFLKVLQYKQPHRNGKPWMLKSLQHSLSLGLRNMFKMFPEAVALITHRRMDQVIPSLCSVQSVHIRASSSDSFDRREMGHRLIPLLKAAMEDMIAVRKEMPANKFVDIQYRDTLTDPMGTYRKGLEGMGLTVTTEDLHEASTWMAKNGRDTHPPHPYTPEDFGTSAAELSEIFKFYHDAYDIKK